MMVFEDGSETCALNKENLIAGGLMCGSYFLVSSESTSACQSPTHPRTYTRPTPVSWKLFLEFFLKRYFPSVFGAKKQTKKE